ncbi:hypothetical protein pb186bvf_005141 [Paramecium bursaria]
MNLFSSISILYLELSSKEIITFQHTNFPANQKTMNLYKKKNHKILILDKKIILVFDFDILFLQDKSLIKQNKNMFGNQNYLNKLCHAQIFKVFAQFKVNVMFACLSFIYQLCYAYRAINNEFKYLSQLTTQSTIKQLKFLFLQIILIVVNEPTKILFYSQQLNLFQHP